MRRRRCRAARAEPDPVIEVHCSWSCGKIVQALAQGRLSVSESRAPLENQGDRSTCPLRRVTEVSLSAEVTTGKGETVRLCDFFPCLRAATIDIGLNQNLDELNIAASLGRLPHLEVLRLDVIDHWAHQRATADIQHIMELHGFEQGYSGCLFRLAQAILSEGSEDPESEQERRYPRFPRLRRIELVLDSALWVPDEVAKRLTKHQEDRKGARVDIVSVSQGATGPEGSRDGSDVS